MSSDLDQPPRSVRPEPYIPPEQADNGIGVLSLATGVTGLILSFIPVIGLLSWLLSPTAIVTGMMALRRPAAKGLGLAGLITGVLGLIVCLIWAVVFGIIVYSVKDANNF